MKEIIINSRKIDGRIHRTWKCRLLEETSEYWLFVGEFESEIKHSKLGLIRRGTRSYEYYWREKWFNIFRFHEPEGELKYYYCNLNQPPIFADYVLDYVDLDIDVLVQKDFTYEILDLDEFESHAKRFNYSEELVQQVQRALDELLKIINQRNFPFLS